MGVIDNLYAYIYLRGFKIWTSYRTQLMLNVLSWVLPVFTYYFVGTSLGDKVVSSMHFKDESYISFVVVGLAFQGYISSVITTLSGRLRNEQLYGTIEYYVMSSGGVLSFLIYSALWGFTINTVNAVMILLIGYILGVKYNVNLISAIIIIFLLLSSSLGLGMISAGFTMIVKQGNPISFFFATFTTLTTGVVFPVSVLPDFVKFISYAIPLTWALEGLRYALLEGYSLSQVSEYVIALSLFTFVLIPLGIAFYSYAFKRARYRGTLSEY